MWLGGIFVCVCVCVCVRVCSCACTCVTFLNKCLCFNTDCYRLLPAVVRVGFGSPGKSGIDGINSSTQLLLWSTSRHQSEEKHGNQGRKSQENERDFERHKSAQTLRVGALVSGETVMVWLQHFLELYPKDHKSIIMPLALVWV